MCGEMTQLVPAPSGAPHCQSPETCKVGGGGADSALAHRMIHNWTVIRSMAPRVWNWVAAPAAPGSLLEMHILGPRPRPTESAALGAPSSLFVISPLVTLTQAEVGEPMLADLQGHPTPQSKTYAWSVSIPYPSCLNSACVAYQRFCHKPKKKKKTAPSLNNRNTLPSLIILSSKE